MDSSYIKQVILAGFLLSLSFITTACLMNDNAATASMHNSDNRLAEERARQDAKVAAEQARADAERVIAQQQTQQQAMSQLGASERLYAQGQYLMAARQENTARMMFVIIVFAVMILFAGAVGIWLYCRNNPKPVPWDHQLAMNAPQMLPPVSLQTLLSNEARQIGWEVYGDGKGGVYGQRTKADGTVQQCLLLEDKQS